jgi:ADP-L-glycero-D-manno-heptose 6-epimerase
MRIVITGAAGFIGQNLIKHLNSIGFTRIVAVDTVQSIPRLTGLVYEEFFTPDIVDFQKEDVLVHLGANTDTMETDVEAIIQNNYRYSMQLIIKALGKGCRVIYASSAGVYGNDTDFTDSEDFDTICKLNPTTTYARSKQHLDIWNLAIGTKCASLRFFNVFGDREQHKGRMESIVSKKYYEIKEGLPQQLYFHPAKTFSRDFIYVKDVVKIIIGFIHSDAVGIYNVGTGISLTWHELMTNYFEVFGKPAIIEPVEFPKERESNYQFYTKSDNTKLLSLDFMKNYEFYHNHAALKDFIHERQIRSE